MVKTIHDAKSFSVSVTAFDENGDVRFDKLVESLTFMQAADYFESGVNYFRFAIQDHANWTSIQLEINSIVAGLVEAIEITRD